MLIICYIYYIIYKSHYVTYIRNYVMVNTLSDKECVKDEISTF